MTSYTSADFHNIDSIRDLMSKLNFDFEDAPVDMHSWREDQNDAVSVARIIARKHDYRVYYIQLKTVSDRFWKEIAMRIIRENAGLCMVCIHIPTTFKWVFSNLSRNFSNAFSETRHIPIELNPNGGVELPKPLVEFLEFMKLNETATSTYTVMDQVSNAFDRYAVEISDELKINVFDALKALSEGIVLDEYNDMVLNEATLEEIREPIFTLLYRIIFVLYAEDRNVFPIDDEVYFKEFSIKWIKHNWLLEDTTTISEYGVQTRLWKLFKLIESGSASMGYAQKEFQMKSYYGRLFDSKHNDHLQSFKIKNQYLLQMLNLLTRSLDKEGNYFFFDYSALGTGNLGSIYEGLLEYHLVIKNDRIVELPNKADRKSLGIYYTPPHVVDYIVEKSVGPLIDDIVKSTIKSDEQIEKILKLNILDPAMGSGHFLVGAMNYIAKRICEIESQIAGGGGGEDAQAGGATNEIAESALTERKRDVARQCLYGVDLNPLAVDLAHVSLWLETMSSEKPLSYLSAHLKTGNSLIGAALNDLFARQTTFMEYASGSERMEFKKVVKDFIMLEQIEDDSPAAVKIKSEKYEMMRSSQSIHHKLKLLLDAKVSKDFGVDFPDLNEYIAKIGKENLDFYTNDTWPSVESIATEHSFFHWDLEFMDVFFDIHGNKKANSGFDCVLGNPPYGAGLSHVVRQYYKKFALDSTDTAQLMMQAAQNLLTEHGCNSFIVPKSLAYASNWQKIRSEVVPNLSILVDCKKVWKEVKLEQAIYVLWRGAKTKSYLSGVRKGQSLTADVTVNKSDCTKFGSLICGVTQDELLLGKKLHDRSEMLNNYITNSRGATLQQKIKKKGDLICLGGRNIARYRLIEHRGYLNIGDINTPKAHVQKNSILTQGILAHIANPVDHIKIMATVPSNDNIVILDTVNQLHVNRIDPLYVLGLLNSKLINWYVYRFIFTKAIRNMRIDNPTTSRIPIRVGNQHDVVTIVNQLLTLHANKPFPSPQIKLLESKLNHSFYDIFDLSDTEIDIVESAMPD